MLFDTPEGSREEEGIEDEWDAVNDEETAGHMEMYD